MAAIRSNFIDNISETFFPIEMKQQSSDDEINLLQNNIKKSDDLSQFESLQKLETTDGMSNVMENNENEEKKINAVMNEEEIIQKNHIWYSKVMRFVGYCLNGGLTEFSLTYEKFINEIILKIQTTNSDIVDLIYQTINLVNGKQISKELTSNRDIMTIILSGNDLKFNEDIFAVCIRTGFLAKIICDNIGIFCKLLNYILENNCSNKILSNLWEYLKTVDEQSEANQGSGEKREYLNIMTNLSNIFKDRRRPVSTLILACKCLSILVSKEPDKIGRIKLVEEVEIINIIAQHLNYFDYEEKLVLCCLELFSLVLPEASSKINDYLYSQDVRLLETLRKFLTATDVPGVYYSQRIIIKVLTVFLNLTNITQSELKENISGKYKNILGLLIQLVDEDSKKKVIDSSEEESSILEYKVYWLLCILTFKNKNSKEYLFSKNLKELVEKKAEKYITIVTLISNFKAKGGYTENKIIAITKNICKFFEFIYYLIIKDSARISEFRKMADNFNKLRQKVQENKEVLMLTEKDSEVFNMIEKLFKIDEGSY